MKSVMTHDFSRIPQANIPRSVFNRSHGYKTTFDAGYLIPFFVDEALPGDSFNLSATIFCRMTTPIYPIMDNLFLDVHYFAVPLRLVWSNFQKFMGETDDPYDPDDTTEYLTPQIVSPVSTGWTVGTLSDYFGLPTGIAGISVNSFHHRAYNLIYNDWYRDQNMQDSIVVDTDDGPDTNSDYVLLKRGKRHDYFTSCLPWPQKGPGVELPLGTTAPIILGDNFGSGGATRDGEFYVSWQNNASARPSAHGSATLGTSGTILPQDSGYNLYADLTEANSATINSLRLAFQIQKLYERDARGGTRYVELVRSHFGVISPDARLQRPEYLGGSTSPVTLTTVAQTAPKPASGTTTPLGSVSAVGTITARNVGFTKSFVEHSVILGIMSVRADLTYQQGTPRMFSRRTRFDYYWPALAHLGEQEVLNKEIYTQGTSEDNEVFGYQERWAEYRYFPSKITGEFRSTFAQTLDAWHLSQEFEDLPTLSPAFIEETPPMSRVLAVADAPNFLMDSYIDVKCARPMPVYSVPGLIDHF